MLPSLLGLPLLPWQGLRYHATTKKMRAETSEANINAGLAAARQIMGFLEKGDRTYQVNK